MSRNQERLDEHLAAALLDIGAISFNAQSPYTWASGLRSPVYCDNRLTIAHPAIRRMIMNGFVSVVRREGYDPSVIAGTATAGIPHAAWLANSLDLPLAYVRGGAKSHGTGKQVEGSVDPGSQVLLVEDLVSTGGSSLLAVEALRESGASVQAVLAVFSYGLDSSERAFRAMNVRLHTLTNFETLLAVARREGRLDPATEETLILWRRDPEAWSEGWRA